MYWDFENLHAGVLEARYGEGIYAKPDNRFKPQEPLVNVQALVELAASFGPVAINRAHGKANPAVDLLRRAVHLLAETRGEPWVKKASVLPMIKRLDPTFDPKDYQYASFAELLKALDSVIEVRKGENDHELRLR